MYTLYQIQMPHLALTKIKDGDRGQLAKDMDSLKRSNKSNLYAIYRGNTLVTSMLNK